jgi:tetratricopeptide (TPR) repeat protein
VTRGELAGGAAIVTLLIALFHGPALTGRFVYDDHWTIEDNAFLRTPATSLPALLGPGPARAGVPDAGRPVMVATEMLDHALWKLRPVGYHLQNLLWHAGVAVLFLLVAVSLTGSFPAGLTAAALFAVHPAHVEAVAAINYREDLLAAFFALAALLVVGRTRLAAFVLLLLGVLAKESAAVAPLLLALRPPDPDRRGRRLDLLVLVAAVAAGMAWRGWVMGGAGIVSRTADIPELHRHWWYAVPEGARSLLAGMLGVLMPVRRFSAEYDDLAPGPLATLLRWGALVLVIALAVIAWRGRRVRPLLALGVLGGVAAYLPTSGLVAISNLRADRYLYLPSLPVLLALAGAVVPRLERLPWLRGQPLFELPRAWLAVVAVLVALGLRTRQQARVWHDDLTLWTQAAAVAPGAPRAWNALAEARLRAGQPGGAVVAARRSVALVDDAQAREILGLALLEQGDLAAARGTLEGALAAAPPALRPELLDNLGLCEEALGQVEAALARFAQARRLSPAFERPWLNAARTLERSGRADEALALLQGLVQTVPASFEGWARLGSALAARGRAAEALAAFRRARDLGHPDPAVAARAAGRRPD